MRFKIYEELFKEKKTNKMPIEPMSSEQSETLITGATTKEILKDKWSVAVYENFHGGYHKLTEFLNSGLTIYQIKLVKLNESSGMRFDGFVYVNKHWVIFPKMWRIIKD